MLTITELNKLEKQLNRNLIQVINGLRQAAYDQKNNQYTGEQATAPFTKQIVAESMLHGDVDANYKLGYLYGTEAKQSEYRALILACYAEHLAMIHFGRNVSWESNQAQEPFFNVRLIARLARKIQPIQAQERNGFEKAYDQLYTDLLIRREINTPEQVEDLVDSLSHQVAAAA